MVIAATPKSIFTLRRLGNAIEDLSQPLLGPKIVRENDWTDEQIIEAYQQIAPFYGKRCIVNQPARAGEHYSTEGILRPGLSAIDFLYYCGARPTSTFFSIEDLALVMRDPIPTFNASVDARLKAEFPLYGLNALEARVKLYFAGVRKPE